MQDLARNPNVFCKVGGLGTSYWGFGFNERSDAISYQEAASAWKPYVETAIEAFGADRCMMESNYPNDGRSCGFVPLWNALKYIVKDYSVGRKGRAVPRHRSEGLPHRPAIGLGTSSKHIHDKRVLRAFGNRERTRS